jgi:hypothetical protein
MNFTTKKGTKSAFSDCGYYEIAASFNEANKQMYFNATYLPSKRSIEGSYDKEACKTACEKHAQRMIAQKENMTGVRCA